MSVVERNSVNVIGPRVDLANAGDRRTLVFSHGFGCDQSMWRFVAPRFADEHRVVLFDHVGAGGSDLSAYCPQRYGSLDAYADDLLDILHELHLHDVVFVGHSVSAMIGALAVIKEPDRFAGLVMVGPSPRYIDDDGYRGGFSAPEIDELLESLDSNYLGWSAAMAPVIMGNADRPELGEELTNSFCRTDPAIARRFAEVTFRADHRAELRRVSVPTLILQCSEDVIAPHEVGVYCHANIPGSTMVVLEATGHCPNLSAPDETYAAIDGFLWKG
ncbi:alpha/beta hydrolase [Dactylosporangium aurantiacum]|uniref:Alpha/beta hydrolase n=1 Tax=Dactylosporangium aurantiacum TaxID=35754 RepID=A0A9Q9ILW0_9ACTN|nr:alpha/beta hydrolase [Dactylosporangium aurantiacum]MDG6105862.1 alpha/beta hydrolase [Dactylosporangium aurantiacum]UWZ57961.1 alpha/beta hydrolase [Dactylosporangium aurantiacum]